MTTEEILEAIRILGPLMRDEPQIRVTVVKLALEIQERLEEDV